MTEQYSRDVYPLLDDALPVWEQEKQARASRAAIREYRMQRVRQETIASLRERLVNYVRWTYGLAGASVLTFQFTTRDIPQGAWNDVTVDYDSSAYPGVEVFLFVAPWLAHYAQAACDPYESLPGAGSQVHYRVVCPVCQQVDDDHNPQVTMPVRNDGPAAFTAAWVGWMSEWVLPCKSCEIAHQRAERINATILNTDNPNDPYDSSARRAERRAEDDDLPF